MPHLVKWAIIYLDKRKGGLGVRSFSTLNRALLCKWSWHFGSIILVGSLGWKEEDGVLEK